MKNSKYEITNIRKDGLYRIRAVRDFANIKEGTLGGFIEDERGCSVSTAYASVWQKAGEK